MIPANAASFCVSPLKNADTWIAVPSSEGVTVVCVANAGSFAISACRSSTAAWTSGACTLPVITICAGSVRPPANSFSSVMKAALDAIVSGNWLIPVELPLFIWK